MVKGSDFKQGLSGISKTKQDAIREAEWRMNNFGSTWCVVKVPGGYAAVHEIYLKTHKAKPIKTIKSIYAYHEVWYKRLLIIPIKGLTKILQWLTRR